MINLIYFHHCTGGPFVICRSEKAGLAQLNNIVDFSWFLLTFSANLSLGKQVLSLLHVYQLAIFFCANS